MKTKTAEKLRAIQLRKQGLSYREILEHIKVSKSSLSLWLKEVKLTKEQQFHILSKRENSWIAGGKVRHEMRIKEIHDTYLEGKTMVGTLSEREIFLIAATLYWAEGSKQKRGSSHRAGICNSDPGVLQIFYSWLMRIGYSPDCIRCSVYIHEEYRKNENEVLAYWKSLFPDQHIQWGKVVYKHHFKKKPFVRYNKDYSERYGQPSFQTYYGLLRFDVRRSARLTRFLAGSALAMSEQCRVV